MQVENTLLRRRYTANGGDHRSTMASKTLAITWVSAVGFKLCVPAAAALKLSFPLVELSE